MSPPAALAPSPLGTAQHSFFPQLCMYRTLPGHLSAPRQDHPPTHMQGRELPGCWWDQEAPSSSPQHVSPA